jgi:hypothetical protein
MKKFNLKTVNDSLSRGEMRTINGGGFQSESCRDECSGGGCGGTDICLQFYCTDNPITYEYLCMPPNDVIV